MIESTVFLFLTVQFIGKCHYLNGRTAAEKEEGVRCKQMHMKPAFNDGSQRIDPGAEISVYPQTI